MNVHEVPIDTEVKKHARRTKEYWTENNSAQKKILIKTDRTGVTNNLEPNKGMTN